MSSLFSPLVRVEHLKAAWIDIKTKKATGGIDGEKLKENNVGFQGQVQQGATDVVNEMLNYRYAILYTRVRYAVLQAQFCTTPNEKRKRSPPVPSSEGPRRFAKIPPAFQVSRRPMTVYHLFANLFFKRFPKRVAKIKIFKNLSC